MPPTKKPQAVEGSEAQPNQPDQPKTGADQPSQAPHQQSTEQGQQAQTQQAQQTDPTASQSQSATNGNGDGEGARDGLTDEQRESLEAQREAEEAFAEREPTPPATVVITSDAVYHGSAVSVFADDDGETPEPGDVDILAALAEVGPDDEPVELDAEPVTSLQIVAATGGGVLAINGNAYSFTPGQAGTLGLLVEKMTVAVGG